MSDISWNKDAMINDLNKQILRLQEKIKELDGKIAEYEKLTSTYEERMTSLLTQLVNEIKPPIYDYFEKLIDQNYKTIADDFNQRLKGMAHLLSEIIDEQVERRVHDAIAKKHTIKVVNVDAETARRVEGENDDNRQK